MEVATSGPQARDGRLAGWFDLDVPGGEATLAALGQSVDERAFTLPMVARALFVRDQRISVSDAQLAKMLAEIAADAGSSDSLTVPVPLDANTWLDILPPVKPPATSDLFRRIITDRNALLLVSGLMATTDSVRAFFARDRETLRFIYQEGAGAFALVARRLQIDDGAVVVPGEADASTAWQALVEVSPANAGAFLRALVTRDHGRLAWYFDSVAGLDAAQLAAAWPAAVPPRERAETLYQVFRESDPQWRIADQPFRRGPIDAWMVLTQNHSADGVATSVLPQATWSLLFDNARVDDERIARTLGDDARGVSLAWLVRATLSPVVRERRNRHEMFRFAQRVFPAAPRAALVDVAVSVSGIRHSRALVLTLERMGLRDPAIFAAAVQAARHVSERADDRRHALVTFQATVALLERMRHVRTLDLATAGRLVRSLSDTVRTDNRAVQSVAKWIVSTLVPAIPRLVRPDAWTTTTAYESTILQALAGPAEREVPTVPWEGLAYVADPIAAEHDRLHDMRALLPSPGLDGALSSGRPQELAEALTALVYATALGDPAGPASLSPDVMTRHRFGLSGTALLRDELPWAPPEERQGNGPWHVEGSLLGLDLGLSRLFLRRIADQQMPQAPTLTLNDLGTLTRTAVAMVPGELMDAHRDALAAAIGRGRERVRMARTPTDLDALAAECGMSATTRQLLPWMASRQPDTVRDVFALRDLLWLGKPALPADVLDRWGVAAEGLDGRRVLAMPAPRPWEDYAGRSEVGQLTTQVPDLTLRLVEETARLQLPAQLIPSLLAFALEDYWHDVRARFADDWPRLTRHAAEVTSSRIHDYVAALVGGGPLRAQ